MAALVCEICGGKLMAKAGGIFECDSCGMMYDKSRIQEMVQEIKGTVKVEGTVAVQGTVKVEGPVKVEGAASADSLLKRGQMALEDRKFDEAARYFEQVLDIDPERGAAYWGLALVDVRGDGDRLARNCLDREPKNVERARQFADAETKTKLDALDEKVEEILHYMQEEARRNEEKARRREEEARKKEETQRSELLRLLPAWRCNVNSQGMISAGRNAWSAARLNDGRVAITGLDADNLSNAASWKNITTISAGSYHLLGLTAAGTVLAVGSGLSGQCKVDSWSDIVSVAAGSSHSVGLRSDGKVVAAGAKDYIDGVSGWSDITAISAGATVTLGLRRNGTVVFTGINGDEGEVSKWTDIVAVSAGSNHSVGLRKDGTVVATGYCAKGVKNWSDIIAISAGDIYTLGLQSNGTVVFAGRKDRGLDKVSDWRNIVAISAGGGHALGLRVDGTVVAAGRNDYGQSNVDRWKCFHSFSTLVQQLESARLEAQHRFEEMRQAQIAGLKSEKASIEAELPNVKGLFAGSKRSKLEARLAEINSELKKLGE